MSSVVSGRVGFDRWALAWVSAWALGWAFVAGCRLPHAPLQDVAPSESLAPMEDVVEADIPEEVTRDGGTDAGGDVGADGGDLDGTVADASDPDGASEGGTCPAEQTFCEGRCVRLAEDPANCGGCGRSCPRGPRGEPRCASGVCGFACERGFADCDGAASNGCEASLESTEHCGACRNRCASGTPVCDPVARACVTMCPRGATRCDNTCVDTREDARHCGGCGRRCALMNASATCAMGACEVLACDPGFGNCDGSAWNGCETSITGSMLHCGRCGAQCMLPNASASCVGGACAVASCYGGARDCDRVASNGCETDTLNDSMNCGACGTTCALPRASGFCTGGNCRVGTCDPGFGDCDYQSPNGCETDVLTDENHCGGCARRCVLFGARAACVDGRCAVASCLSGYSDCDRMAANGCERLGACPDGGG